MSSTGLRKRRGKGSPTTGGATSSHSGWADAESYAHGADDSPSRARAEARGNNAKGKVKDDSSGNDAGLGVTAVLNRNTTFGATGHVKDQGARTSAAERGYSRAEHYGSRRAKKPRKVDVTRMGNIGAKVRMLKDSRNLRFKELYKPPDPVVAIVFLVTVIAFIVIFNYVQSLNQM